MTKELSLRDIGLLKIITDLDAENTKIPNVDFLTGHTSDGATSIRTGLNILIKKGLVERNKLGGGLAEIKLIKEAKKGVAK